MRALKKVGGGDLFLYNLSKRRYIFRRGQNKTELSRQLNIVYLIVNPYKIWLFCLDSFWMCHGLKVPCTHTRTGEREHSYARQVSKTHSRDFKTCKTGEISISKFLTNTIFSLHEVMKVK